MICPCADCHCRPPSAHDALLIKLRKMAGLTLFGRSHLPGTRQARPAHHGVRRGRLHWGQSMAKHDPSQKSFGGPHLKVLRQWRKICFRNESWLRAIDLCQDAEGLWVAFIKANPEGPDVIVYLPVPDVLPVADALESVAECDDKTYRFFPSPVFGKDHWSKPARVNGVAYTRVVFRYRPVLVFNGPEGIWTAQLVSGRHARLLGRLLRMLHQRCSAAIAQH